jgi:iron(III) transport system substrate-binding protein
MEMHVMKQGHSWLAAGLVLLALLLPVACGVGAGPTSGGPVTTPGSDIKGIEAAAKSEGSVTLYTAQTQSVIDALSKAFQAKYGIKVNAFEAATTALKTRFQAELNSGQVLGDVVVVGEHTIFDTNSAAIANISDLPVWGAYPTKFRSPNYAVTSIQFQVMLINTNKVKKGQITRWTDIVDPQWKGQIAMISVGAATSTQSLYTLLAKTYGDEFATKLGAQKPKFQTASAPTAQLVAAGEVAIGFPISYSVINALIQSGAPVATLELDPISGAELNAAVPVKAPHPNAARLLMNFMLSKEGQGIINGGNLGASPLPNISGAAPLPAKYTSPNEAVPTAEWKRVGSLLGSP